MRSTDDPIIVEQMLNTTIDKAWKAITALEEMKQWFFGNIESFRPQVGFETQFAVQVEDRVFTHLWKITEVLPYQKISYKWKYEEFPGDAEVSFEIAEERNKVRLRLTFNVLEDFPEDIPEFSRKSCIGGWNYFIGLNLKAYIDKHSDTTYSKPE